MFEPSVKNLSMSEHMLDVCYTVGVHVRNTNPFQPVWNQSWDGLHGPGAVYTRPWLLE